MKILEKTRDAGGKWMVRIEITSLFITFFTFKHDPLDTEVEDVVHNYCMSLNNEEYNNIKPAFLKIVENEYFIFIRDEWNKCLKTNGIISQDEEVTITNTDENKNIQYLLILKRINKQDYYNMAGEFDRYKRLVNDNGGIMSRVNFHETI